MARRRPRVVRSVRGKTTSWIAISDEITVTDFGSVSVLLFSPSDIVGPSVDVSITLLRIRGYLIVEPSLVTEEVTVAATQIAPLAMYIAQFRADETFEPPLATNAYLDEDILWTGGAFYAVPRSITTRFMQTSQSFTAAPMHIDIKAKRRMRQNDTIAFVVEHAGGNSTGQIESANVRLVLRALFRNP